MPEKIWRGGRRTGNSIAENWNLFLPFENYLSSDRIRHFDKDSTTRFAKGSATRARSVLKKTAVLRGIGVSLCHVNLQITEISGGLELLARRDLLRGGHLFDTSHTFA